MNTEEDNEIAIHTQAFDIGRITPPRTTIKPKQRIEQPRRNFPGDTRPLVDMLRHLTEPQHVRLVPRPVSLVAFNVTGDVRNGTKTRNHELPLLAVV